MRGKERERRGNSYFFLVFKLFYLFDSQDVHTNTTGHDLQTG